MSAHTRVESSLTPLRAILASKRHQRAARKWPWAWWCRTCEDAYGAGRTEQDAKKAADAHEAQAHAGAEL
ncbi:hypothetical protein ACF09L_19095 [Streptomyces sp. NPDC014779]|uniref:hypothetical protein n=1 Tax=Streptomyces sp. NPDC014779 TaxID=3364911 RepID=UPI003702263A